MTVSALLFFKFLSNCVCFSDICSLRLDFDTFSILGGTTTDGLSDNEFECQDTFDVTGLTTAQNIPTICGMNNGQHSKSTFAGFEHSSNGSLFSVYIDLGMSPSSTANLNFAFSSASGSRSFEIKISQIKCDDVNRPKPGCLQYFTGTEGRITSFNFEANLHHLNNQRYTVCIRQEEGFCCNLYTACSDSSSFTLDDNNSDGTPEALHGSECSDDYIEIEGSSGVCNGRTFFTRYCGDVLSFTQEADFGTSICGK